MREKRLQGGGLVPVTVGEDHSPEREGAVIELAMLVECQGGEGEWIQCGQCLRCVEGHLRPDNLSS